MTNALSRNIRAVLRARFLAEAEFQGDTFTVRCQNECYACRLKSRSHCLNSCKSSVNPNSRDDSLQIVEVQLSISGGGASN